MSVELPPLPKSTTIFTVQFANVDWFTADQLRAYATEALAAQSAELAECKDAYALLFKENARLRAEVEKRKPLTPEEIRLAVGAEQTFWATSRLWIISIARAIERTHGIGEQE